MPDRRALQFSSMQAIADDVDQLLKSGYTSVGAWNLSQTCGHLDTWLRFSMDGYPTPRFPMNCLLWGMRVTMGRKQLNRIITRGFKPGTPTMPKTVPVADAVEDAVAAKALLQTIARFESCTDAIHPSPLFGKLSKEEAEKLQRAHAALHLSFLLPNM
ncbi:MAG: DUF1569 domain-containing protein [Phycisphaerales bacterium]